MRERKARHWLDSVGAELNKVMYETMKDRIEGCYYGEAAAKFDEMVRRGILVVEKDNGNIETGQGSVEDFG